MGKSKILIVEDSEVLREGLFKDLVKESHEVIAKVDGQDAWTYLDANSTPVVCVDLIVCDLNMPNMTGLELLRKLRGDERFRKVPFFILTTQTEQRAILSAVESGASGFVTKPYSTSALYSKIAPYLQKT